MQHLRQHPDVRAWAEGMAQAHVARLKRFGMGSVMAHEEIVDLYSGMLLDLMYEESRKWWVDYLRLPESLMGDTKALEAEIMRLMPPSV